MSAVLLNIFLSLFITAGVSAGTPVSKKSASKDTISKVTVSKECKFPAEPINWIMKYCAYVAETDDEVAIQDSKCFKDASADVADPDKCEIKRKYKDKLCLEITKGARGEKKAYFSVDSCVADKSIKPFFAGESSN